MFDFKAIIINNDYIYTNKSFDVLIKTINYSNKDFYYGGSSTIVGATIYLKNKNGLIIRPNDIPVTNDYQKNIFKANSIIERVWNFEKIEEPGCYDLYISFYGYIKIVYGFIFIEKIKY